MKADKKIYLFGVLIILLALLTKSVAGVICEFCNKDFLSLGRHTWRCKSRATQIDENIQINCQPLSPKATVVTQNENNVVIMQVNQDIDPHDNEKKVNKFRRYCGREFKSVRGLNTHRRSYFLGKTPSIAELFEDEDAVGEINDIPTDDNENNLTGLIDLPKGEIKKECSYRIVCRIWRVQTSSLERTFITVLILRR